jgi:hypothetical protein
VGISLIFGEESMRHLAWKKCKIVNDGSQNIGFVSSPKIIKFKNPHNQLIVRVFLHL